MKGVEHHRPTMRVPSGHGGRSRRRRRTPISLCRTTLFIILLHIIIFLVLVICLLTNPGYCDQDPIIPVVLIHGISDCVTRISSPVMIHYSIKYSIIIGICSIVYFLSSVKNLRCADTVWGLVAQCYICTELCYFLGGVTRKVFS